MAAFRTLWAAMVGLYEETLVLVGGSLAALVLNLPVGLALLVLSALAALGVGVPLLPSDDGSGTPWPLVIVAWLMLFLPTPGNVALAGLTQVTAGRDAPRFALLRASLRTHWRLALRCTVVSTLVTLALLANVYFYVVVSSGWLRFVSILWLYAVLLWLSLHIYLVPLLVHVAEPRVVDVYRRAAFLALGHAGYTFLLLFSLLGFGLVAVVFLPVYVLIGPAYVSVVQAHAWREIRRRHGDLVDGREEEVSRL